MRIQSRSPLVRNELQVSKKNTCSVGRKWVYIVNWPNAKLTPDYRGGSPITRDNTLRQRLERLGKLPKQNSKDFRVSESLDATDLELIQIIAAVSGHKEIASNASRALKTARQTTNANQVKYKIEPGEITSAAAEKPRSKTRQSRDDVLEQSRGTDDGTLDS